MAFAATIWMLLILRLISGLTSANYAVGNAYIADITPPEKRAASFGLFGAGFGIGFVIGPMLGGLLAEYGTRAPFLAAAGLTFLNLAFVAFVLPETVKSTKRVLPKLGEVNPISSFGRFLKLPGLRGLLTMVSMNEIAIIVYPAVWAFFAIEALEWTTLQVGLSLTVFGLCMAVVQAGVIRLYLKYLGEFGTVILGLVLNIFVFSVMAFNTNGMIAMALIPISAMGAVILPPLKSMMSRRAPANMQGELLGIVSSTGSVGAIIGPIIATVSFRAFTHEDALIYLPGIPFAISALLFIGSLLTILILRRSVLKK